MRGKMLNLAPFSRKWLSNRTMKENRQKSMSSVKESRFCPLFFAQKANLSLKPATQKQKL